jgi:hypothetical protein
LFYDYSPTLNEYILHHAKERRTLFTGTFKQFFSSQNSKYLDAATKSLNKIVTDGNTQPSGSGVLIDSIVELQLGSQNQVGRKPTSVATQPDAR